MNGFQSEESMAYPWNPWPTWVCSVHSPTGFDPGDSTLTPPNFRGPSPGSRLGQKEALLADDEHKGLMEHIRSVVRSIIPKTFHLRCR